MVGQKTPNLRYGPFVKEIRIFWNFLKNNYVQQARALRDLAAAQVVTSHAIKTNIFPDLQEINSLKIRESGSEKCNFEFFLEFLVFFHTIFEI